MSDEVRIRDVGDPPQRMCVACRSVRGQDALLRLAATPDGVRLDRRRRLPGRGAYLCPDPDCIDAAAGRGGRALRRALRAGSGAGLEDALTAARAASPTRTTAGTAAGHETNGTTPTVTSATTTRGA